MNIDPNLPPELGFDCAKTVSNFSLKGGERDCPDCRSDSCSSTGAIYPKTLSVP